MAKSYKTMLDEMRHSFDTAYMSVSKYANKTFTVFGGELAFVLFYMSSDEISTIINLFHHPESGWFVFALPAIVAFIVAAVLFILTLATDRQWSFPPAEDRLLYNDNYKTMSEETLSHEIIAEYKHDIGLCVKKVHRMKILSDTGVYFLVGGVVCLLILKIFGV